MAEHYGDRKIWWLIFLIISVLIVGIVYILFFSNTAPIKMTLPIMFFLVFSTASLIVTTGLYFDWFINPPPKQMKNIVLTVSFNGQPLRIHGKIETKPERDGYMGTGWFLACHILSFTIDNISRFPVDTKGDENPIFLDLDIKGTPTIVKLLEITPSNFELTYDAISEKIALWDVKLAPGKAFKIKMIAWYAT